jgi:hypothetical protein
MSRPNQPPPDRVERAAATARQLLGDDPSVVLIDVGLDQSSPAEAASPAVRVHIRSREDLDRLRHENRLPAVIEGISVIAVVADYRLDKPSGRGSVPDEGELG